MKEIFRKPSLQMISFTITEKGYALKNLDGAYFPVVAQDIQNGPGQPRHAMSVVAALLYERFKAGALPLAVVSMDNCSHNGEKLQSSVLAVAKEWQKAGLVEAEFVAYLEDETKVAFPWSCLLYTSYRHCQKRSQIRFSGDSARRFSGDGYDQHNRCDPQKASATGLLRGRTVWNRGGFGLWTDHLRGRRGGI